VHSDHSSTWLAFPPAAESHVSTTVLLQLPPHEDVSQGSQGGQESQKKEGAEAQWALWLEIAEMQGNSPPSLIYVIENVCSYLFPDNVIRISFSF